MAEQGELERLEPRLWKVWDLLMQMVQEERGHYLEMKTWLLSSISQLQPTPRIRQRAFGPCLYKAGSTDQPGGISDGGVPAAACQQQLIMLWIEQQPATAAQVLLEEPELIKSFFEGSSKNIMLWFSHFSMDGLPSFRYGARALALYALANRDQVWHHLVWEGKHPQAPVTVATKTHYFCELDVVSSVRALLREVPGFWTSELFRDAVCAHAAELLHLDRHFFCKTFTDLLNKQRGERRTWALLREHLDTWLQSTAEWGPLCRRVLHMLPDDQLLQVIETVGASPELQLARHDAQAATPGSTGKGGAALDPESAGQALQAAAASCMRALVLCGGPRWQSLQTLVLTHALAMCRQQLLRLILEDEEQASRLQQLVQLSAQPAVEQQDAQHRRDAERQLASGLRNVETSASSRQVLAVYGWILHLFMCTPPSPEEREEAQAASAGIQMHRQGGRLATMVHSVGGTAQLLDSGQQPSRTHLQHSGRTAAAREDKGKQYELLTSSASSDSASESSGGSSQGAALSSGANRSQHSKQARGSRKRKHHRKHRRGDGKKRRTKRHKRRRGSPGPSFASTDAGHDGHTSEDASDYIHDRGQLQGGSGLPSRRHLQALADLTWSATLPAALVVPGCSNAQGAGNAAVTMSSMDFVDVLASSAVWRTMACQLQESASAMHQTPDVSLKAFSR